MNFLLLFAVVAAIIAPIESGTSDQSEGGSTEANRVNILRNAERTRIANSAGATAQSHRFTIKGPYPRTRTSPNDKQLVDLLYTLGFSIESGRYTNERTGKDGWYYRVMSLRENSAVKAAGVKELDFSAGFSVGNDRSGNQFKFESYSDLKAMANYPEVHVRFNKLHSEDLRAVVTLDTRVLENNLRGVPRFNPATMPAYKNPAFRQKTTLANGTFYFDPESCKTDDVKAYMVLRDPNKLLDFDTRIMISESASRACGSDGMVVRWRPASVEIFDEADRRYGIWLARERYYLLKANDNGSDASYAFGKSREYGMGYLEQYCTIGVKPSCKLFATKQFLLGLERYKDVLEARNGGPNAVSGIRTVRQFNAAIDEAKFHLEKARWADPSLSDEWDKYLSDLNSKYQ